MKRLSDRFAELLQYRLDMEEERTDAGDTALTFKALAATLDEFQAEVEQRFATIKPAQLPSKGAWWERAGGDRRK